MKNITNKLVKASHFPKDLIFAFSQIDALCSEITTTSSSKYIEVLSYLDSNTIFSDTIRNYFLSIITNLILYETLMPYNFDLQSFSQAIKHAQLSLSLFIISKSKTKHLQGEVMSSLKSLLEKSHSVIAEFFISISGDSQNKLRVLAKINEIRRTVKFEWNLIALKNLNERKVNRESFPVYTKTSEPFLPQNDEKTCTLVLDLDETLVHSTGETVFVRPGAENFIKKMEEKYEIVIFTSGIKEYADYVMKKIDPEGRIKLRLSREHVSFDNFGPFKDLRKLGRNLENVLIVDNIEKNFRYTLENGICIKDWTGDMTDNELMIMAERVEEWFSN